jgi:saccharopine dehydrogenase (NAD+, L-lysine-forming)
LLRSQPHEILGGGHVNKIGLRKEEKPFETRVPLVPQHVAALSHEHNISFVVEPSSQRAFRPEEYNSKNVQVLPIRGSDANVVLGIKEMPVDFFEPSKVYVFFSHTIKGQKQNMPMLRRIMEVGATLLDYEKIVDGNGHRLIYFGNWAGLAGMSDALRILGERLDYEGISPNPFSGVRPTLQIMRLSDLKEEIHLLGERISRLGLPEVLAPLVIGFAGYGNVSKGAQEIFDILPHESATPEELPKLPKRTDVVYKCVFKEQDMVCPINPKSSFDLQDYYDHGTAKYRSQFEKYIPYLSVLVNCIYWTQKYPRLITKRFIKEHWKSHERRLRVIGDISCDIDGAIELTVMSTKPDHPAFCYNIQKNTIELGIAGNGPIIIAVDNLPCELPRESSLSFSSSLVDFIPALADADLMVPFEELALPKELLDAIIVYRGELTTKYEYLREFVSM